MTRDERRRLVRELMRDRGAELVICASSGRHTIDVANPIAHLTTFRSLGPSLLLLTPSGEDALLASPTSDLERAQAASVAATTIVADDLGMAFETWAARRRWRMVFSVGLEDLPYQLAKRIRASLPAQAKLIDDDFYQATGAKTNDEIAAAREAAAIAERGYERLKEIARPGLKECDLAIELNLAMREFGANDSFLLLNANSRNDAVMPSSERRLQASDILLSELSPSVEGQFVQICRTVGLGDGFEHAIAKYALLAAATNEGIAMARPGARVGAICKAIDDYLSRSGYAQYSQPPFIRRRGHGLGSGSVWPGDVAQDNDAILSPDMLFMVHPNQFLPETGYMMCGEPVLVTPGAPEALTRRRAAFDVIGG